MTILQKVNTEQWRNKILKQLGDCPCIPVAQRETVSLVLLKGDRLSGSPERKFRGSRRGTSPLGNFSQASSQIFCRSSTPPGVRDRRKSLVLRIAALTMNVEMAMSTQQDIVSYPVSGHFPSPGNRTSSLGSFPADGGRPLLHHPGAPTSGITLLRKHDRGALVSMHRRVKSCSNYTETQRSSPDMRYKGILLLFSHTNIYS